MTTIQSLLKELEQEAVTTRKMLALIPNDKFNWQPHPKSMTIQRLATHIAEIPEWVKMVLTTTELDFSNNPYLPRVITETSDMLAYLESTLAEAKSQLEQSTDADLLPTWTLRNGEDIYSVSPKGDMIRTVYCQTVHHRAQLGVYLRLLDIPIPGSYGPSADEHSM